VISSIRPAGVERIRRGRAAFGNELRCLRLQDGQERFVERVGAILIAEDIPPQREPSASAEHRRALAVADVGVYPVKRGGGGHDIERATRKVGGFERVDDDPNIHPHRAPSETFRQRAAGFHERHPRPSSQHRKRRLADARADLEHRRPVGQAASLGEELEQLIRVPRARVHVLVRYQIEERAAVSPLGCGVVVHRDANVSSTPCQWSMLGASFCASSFWPALHTWCVCATDQNPWCGWRRWDLNPTLLRCEC